MKQNLNFIAIQQQDLPALQKTARQIWEHSFHSFLSQAQIEYMLPMMYGVSVIERQIQSGFHWQWIVSSGLGDPLPGNSSSEHAEQAEQAETLRVGYISTELQDQCLYLDKLYIRPEFHRQGIASEILSRLKIRTKSANKAEIRLNVNKKNHNALRTYRKAGFTIIKEECNDIGGGFVMDDYLMGCKIDVESLT